MSVNHSQVITVTPEFIEQLKHITGNNYFQLAAFTILIYDHCLTFSQEVERIWKRPLTGASILFLLNRYVTPIQFTISVDAHNDSRWTKEACHKYAPSQGSMSTAMVAVCELIMILRVYALYGRNNWLLAGLMFIWVVQIVVSSIGLSTGHAVLFSNGIVGCIFSGDSKIFPVIWITPLITDCIVFLLTLYRSKDYFKYGAANIRTLHKFIRDGTLYFFVICLANLLNVLVFFLAPVNDLRTLGASFSNIITSVMISRLVLNLRSDTEKMSPLQRMTLGGESMNPAAVRFMDRAIGDLGHDAGGIDSESDELHGQGVTITRTEVTHTDPRDAYTLHNFDNYALTDFEYKHHRKSMVV